MLKQLTVFGVLIMLAAFAFAAPGTPEAGGAEAGPGGSTYSDDGGGGDTPGDPAHTMDDAVNIYIHVILRQPEGPEADPNLVILTTVSDPGEEYVRLKAQATPTTWGGDFYRCYREGQWPLYYSDDLDPASNLIGRTTGIAFFDYFTDPYWSAFGSMGVADPDVNYYYVYETVDSNIATGELTNSPYPSNCVCEYDQDVLNRAGAGRNVLAYTNEHTFETPGSSVGLQICQTVPGVNRMYKWNYTSQSWVSVTTYIPGLGYFEVAPGAASLDLGDVFMLDMQTGASDQLLSTFAPGYIPDALSYVVDYPDGATSARREWIMIPMKYTYQMRESGTYTLPITYANIGADIEATNDIGDVEDIQIYNPISQATVLVATKIGTTWFDLVPSPQVVPGMVICLMTKDDLTWPPGSGS